MLTCDLSSSLRRNTKGAQKEREPRSLMMPAKHPRSSVNHYYEIVRVDISTQRTLDKSSTTSCIISNVRGQMKKRFYRIAEKVAKQLIADGYKVRVSAQKMPQWKSEPVLSEIILHIKW